MTLIKYAPAPTFGQYARMSQCCNDFENEFSNTFTFAPRTEITEDENSFHILLELPGLTKEEVKISVGEDRSMKISGEKKHAAKEQEYKIIRNERYFGNFSRSFAFSESADLNNVSAKMENGLLEISVSKKEPEKPKEIDVQIY